jgi:hypothetical protein
MLTTIVLNRKLQFIIVQIQFQILIRDGILEKFWADLGEGFLKVEFDELPASNLSLA